MVVAIQGGHRNCRMVGHIVKKPNEVDRGKEVCGSKKNINRKSGTKLKSVCVDGILAFVIISFYDSVINLVVGYLYPECGIVKRSHGIVNREMH